MNRENFTEITDKIILVCLAIQISSVSISIAVSSIAFGIWLSVWLIQILFNRKTGIPGTVLAELKSINVLILLYIFFEIFSRFFALYPEGAFANLKRLLLFLIFFVSVIKITTEKTLFGILILNLIAVAGVSIVEIVRYYLKFSELISQMSFSEIRIDYFNYPITTAEIKMMTLLSLFPLLFIKENLIIRKIYLILPMIPVFISMILTQSRNVMLAIFVCFLIYGIIVNRKFLAGFIFVLALSWIILPSSMTDRIRSIADVKHPSNESRISMWEVGMKMFYDHPLTGVADSHIREIYQTYKKPETEGEGVHLHSNFIMILATTGIFGFLSYMIMFILIFIKQIRIYMESDNILYRILTFGSMLVMISFHVSGIFEWSFGDHEVMTVFFFLVSVPFVLNKLSAETKNEGS